MGLVISPGPMAAMLTISFDAAGKVTGVSGTVPVCPDIYPSFTTLRSFDLSSTSKLAAQAFLDSVFTNVTSIVMKG